MKGNLQLYKNYHIISLISNSDKVILKYIVNILKAEVEAIASAEQAGFRTCRSLGEHIITQLTVIAS